MAADSTSIRFLALLLFVMLASFVAAWITIAMAWLAHHVRGYRLSVFHVMVKLLPFQFLAPIKVTIEAYEKLTDGGEQVRIEQVQRLRLRSSDPDMGVDCLVALVKQHYGKTNHSPNDSGTRKTGECEQSSGRD